MTTPQCSSDLEFVCLPGYACPRPAVELALALERDGFLLSAAGDGADVKLAVRRIDGGRPVLAAETQEEIRRWKPHLAALAEWIRAQGAASEVKR